MRADPEKTEAIHGMESPQSVSELRRFLGMVNQLGKFSPRVAEITQPLRELLSSKKAWIWDQPQEAAFEMIKKELSQPTVLALYNPLAATKVSADASSFGLGAVLFQKVEGAWKPVAYASRAMSDTETRYAQIEKEALAATWACEKFHNYILGKEFSIESDHKPLIPLLGSKNLDNLPPRILRFRLRLAKFDYTIHHVPGKELYTADTLSRAPTGGTKEGDAELQAEVEAYVNSVVKSLPATAQRIREYQQAQEQDPVCTQVKHYCQQGWPSKNSSRPRSSSILEGSEFTYCDGSIADVQQSYSGAQVPTEGDASKSPRGTPGNRAVSSKSCGISLVARSKSTDRADSPEL